MDQFCPPRPVGLENSTLFRFFIEPFPWCAPSRRQWGPPSGSEPRRRCRLPWGPHLTAGASPRARTESSSWQSLNLSNSSNINKHKVASSLSWVSDFHYLRRGVVVFKVKWRELLLCKTYRRQDFTLIESGENI